MTQRNRTIIRRLATAGLLAGLAPLAQAQTPAPMFADPAQQPGYVRSPQTTALNQSMLDQIERNPGAPMASGPITVFPGATVTYPPRVQPAPYPELTPRLQR